MRAKTLAIIVGSIFVITGCTGGVSHGQATLLNDSGNYVTYTDGAH